MTGIQMLTFMFPYGPFVLFIKHHPIEMFDLFQNFGLIIQNQWNWHLVYFVCKMLQLQILVQWHISFHSLQHNFIWMCRGFGANFQTYLGKFTSILFDSVGTFFNKISFQTLKNVLVKASCSMLGSSCLRFTIHEPQTSANTWSSQVMLRHICVAQFVLVSFFQIQSGFQQS